MVILAISCFTGCGAKSEKPLDDTSAPTQTENNKQEEKPNNNSQEDKVSENNYFLNDNNNFYDQNAVSVRPRYVYWKDGKLVAECFVVNGFSHPVYNIEVKGLKFSNGHGVIADAAFGKLDGVVLQPYTHVMWTFTFPADCITKYGADITSLIYNSSVSNSY